MGIEVKDAIINKESFEQNFTNEGGVEGTTRFLKNICGMWLLERCRKEWEATNNYSYTELIDAALTVPAFRSLINPDAPCFSNPTSMIQAIGHYCKETNQPVPQSYGEITRCIFDSLALRYKQVFGYLQQMAPFPIEKLHIIGGGSRNNLLNQFTCNAVGVPVIAGPSEGTAIGNIMLQAKANGLVSDIAAMRQLISTSIETVSFEPQQAEEWEEAYEIAKERYAAVGVDTEKVMETMQNFHLSLHCWQADDVTGFEVQAGSLTGGIQATGNYPGKARNIDELRADILKAASYIPGTHRLNLHEIYGDFQGKVVDRDEVEPEHFKSWIEWGKENNMKLDFNSTSFSHPKSGDLSLSNPDEGIRNFWIEHTKRCRAVAEEMGKAQGDPCIMNLWVHDGSKDITVNRMKYRALLKDSLDQIFATEYKNMKDCIESKVFGIGLESYTVGSNDFYIGYGAKNNKMITLDTGHFHPTESVADKVSSLLLYVPELMLHVSRPVRWDSDHVTIMDDPTMDLFSEIVRCNALDRVHYGLDYFDASINRIGAYVIGSRAAQKCMVRALLEPIAKLREYEANGQGFQRLALLEEEKALPWNAVWDMFCLKNNVPVGEEFIAEVEKYEAEVTSKR